MTKEAVQDIVCKMADYYQVDNAPAPKVVNELYVGTIRDILFSNDPPFRIKTSAIVSPIGN
jgi:hypothetical protein